MIVFCEECGQSNKLRMEVVTSMMSPPRCEACSELLKASEIRAAAEEDFSGSECIAEDLEQSTEPLKLLIVDDSKFIRRAIKKILTQTMHIQVVGEAGNGAQALEIIPQLAPDVVTLDVNMPVMDGLTTLKHIMIKHPTPTVMFSTLTEEGSEVTFDALKYGAIDFMQKPSQMDEMGMEVQQHLIVRKIKLAAAVQLDRVRYLRTPLDDEFKAPKKNTACDYLVAMGAAEGGYGALLKIIPYLRANLPAAYVALLQTETQHVEAFANYLNRFSAVAVKRAAGCEPIQGSTCYLCSSQDEVWIERVNNGLSLQVTRGAQVSNGNTDGLMSSVAQYMGTAAIGLLLSGSGQDGLKGLELIADNGGTTMVQEPAGCLCKETVKLALKGGRIQQVVPDRAMHTALNDLVEAKLCGYD